MFIGREKEITEITKAINSPRFEAILLMGRRRVGKTEIIKKISSNYLDPIISFECKNSLVKDNLDNMSKKIATFFGIPTYQPLFANFDDLFDFLFNKSIERKTKLLFVIDEFSYLLQGDTSVASSLAIAIDKYHNETNLKIIIAGSIIGLMRDMIDGKSPLYGRFTHIINVLPFNYFEASQFYPNYSDEDKILAYSVFGGIAFFNSLINPNITILDNIKTLLLKKDSILEHEVNEMILAETNKIADLNTTIELIGLGTTKYIDLKSKLSSNKRPDYILERLQKMEIIAKNSPINELNNRKQTFYAFKDNLIHFYYRYIHHRLAERNNMNVDDFYEYFVKEDLLTIYVPCKFEEITKEFLIRMNQMGKIKPTFSLIGRYVHHDKIYGTRQFDVVTKDNKGFTAFECKYTKEKITPSVVNEEIYQTNSSNLRFYRLGFIAKSGFSKEVDTKKYRCYQLSDFYRY